LARKRKTCAPQEAKLVLKDIFVAMKQGQIDGVLGHYSRDKVMWNASLGLIAA